MCSCAVEDWEYCSRGKCSITAVRKLFILAMENWSGSVENREYCSCGKCSITSVRKLFILAMENVVWNCGEKGVL